MDLGFETIGNATLICYDGGPVLATDPWLDGPAYFGSWTRTHEIPPAQREAVQACAFLWISHGHPDHLCPQTLATLRDKQILLPDHVGGRIAGELAADGYQVKVLRDGVWTRLSDRMRVASVCNDMQDAVLLVDLDGHLVVDANDCGDRGVGAFLQSVVREYDDSYLLWLTGYGDADFINFFDEQGRRVPPAAAARQPVGPVIGEILDAFGFRAFVPFSSMHKYQRTDSAWANAYITPLEAHAEGFPGDRHDILPAFVRCDLARGDVTGIEPEPASDVLHPPEAFGDNWSDELESGDVQKIRDYFAPITHLRTFLGTLTFRVGGRDHVLDVNPEHDRGLRFELPRQSLMTVIACRIFDDILIGNFAKGTLHGDWGGRVGTAALYPDFNPFVCKYGDNGGARAPAELQAYFAEFRRRGFFDLSRTPSGQAAALALAPYLV